MNKAQDDAGIYLTTETGAIYRWDLATKSTQLMVETGLALTDIAFHPDGRVFAITANSLYQIDPASGKTTLVGALRSDKDLAFNVRQLTDANGFDISPAGIGRISNGNLTLIPAVDLETGKVLNTTGPLFQPGQSSAGDIWFDGAGFYVTTSSNTLVKAVPTTNNSVPTSREAIADDLFIGSNEINALVGMPAGVDGVLPGTLVGFTGNTAYLFGPGQLSVAIGPGYETLNVNGSITGATVKRGVTIESIVSEPVVPKPVVPRPPETTDENIIVAAVNLSDRAYSDTHIKNRSNVDNDQLVIKEINERIKNWSPLEVDKSSFDGTFSPVGDGNLLRYDNSNASVTVGLTVLDGKSTLGIAFEGTNNTKSATTILPFPTQNTVLDLLDDLIITNYFGKLKKFNASIVEWVKANNIEQVLVAGHSLGGAAVQNFMQEYGQDNAKYIGVTFGSPGFVGRFSSSDTDLDAVPNERLVNIQHNDDTVVSLGNIRQYVDNGAIVDVIRKNSGHSIANYRKTVEFITKQVGADVLFRDLLITPGTDGIDQLVDESERENEVLLGGDGTDTLISSQADQILIGGRGDDTLEGGDGVDTAIYTASIANYVPIPNPLDQEFSLTDQRAGSNSDGTDTLNSIERIIFTDSAVALDLDGSAGKVAKLIAAVFGAESVSNTQFVGIGLSELDKGTSYEDLADLAIGAAGANSPEQVVSLLWNNVVGFSPTTDQVQPFIDMLNTGTSTGALGVLAAETSINQDNVDLIGLSDTGIIFDPLHYQPVG